MNTEDIKSKTISGLFWRLSERVLAQLISLIVSIVLARILMPEEYGIVALLMVFINIFNAFVTNGMGTSLVQKKDSDEIDFSTMFYTGLIISLILYIILFLISPIIGVWYANIELVIVLRVMGIKLPIAAINSIQQAYVSKKMEYKKFFYSTLIGTIVSGILGIVAAKSGLGVWALVIQYLTNSLMDTIVLFITVNWRPKLLFSKKRFKSLFSYGYKVMFSGVIGTVFDQLKNFIIGVKYTTTDLAYYNRGEQIPSLAYNNINSSLESVLFPAIAQIQDNKENVKNALRKIINCISYIIMPIMFGLAVVSKPLVLILLTEKWLPCVPFLVVVCIQQCFGIISSVHLQTIKAIGRSDIVLKLEVIKKPIFLIFILVGMYYSPLAIVIANCIYGFLAYAMNANPNRKILKYSLKEQLSDILPALGITSIMVIVCYLVSFLNLNNAIILIMQIIIGIIVYLALSIILRIKAFYQIKNFINNSNIGNYSKILVKKFIAFFFNLKIFKVKNNKIVFDNFNGKGYGCNPKYIAEEIIRQNLNYDLVWLVSDINEEMPSKIRKVKKGSLKSFYELATAKVWIDNVRNSKIVSKKQDQFYIQTWHGAVGMKGIEKDVEEYLSKEYIKEAMLDGKITDLLLTNNKKQVDYIRKYFWYNGKILCVGTPRCDIIYNTPQSVKNKIYDYFKIDKSKKIVLYAPSFRNNNNLNVYKFDYEKCNKILKNKFKNDYVIIIRLHPNVSNYSNEIKYNKNVINGTYYPDVQEIISVSDIVITDYSSIGFEAALVNKPVFIYANDLGEYVKSERKLIYSFDEIPFEVAKTEDELFNNIQNFSLKKYKEKCKKFYDFIGVVHNPESSKDIVEIINKVIKGEYNNE